MERGTRIIMMAMIYYDKRLHAGIITDHNNHKDPRPSSLSLRSLCGMERGTRIIMMVMIYYDQRLL